jgi:hypothetical protein
MRGAIAGDITGSIYENRHVFTRDFPLFHPRSAFTDDAGFVFDSEGEVFREGAGSASPTHNHPEGVKGAQAVALAILVARRKVPKDEIRDDLESGFRYDFSRRIPGRRRGHPRMHGRCNCGGVVRRRSRVRAGYSRPA